MMDYPNFVLNSFQTPNEYVDRVMFYLTSDEYMVLSFMVRRILGFQKRQDHISISQIKHGVMKKNGSGALFLGTGLCIETIKKCLANLIAFGLIVKVGKNSRTTNKGDLWALQWDPDDINWDALKTRQEQKSIANANRITKARAARKALISA